MASTKTLSPKVTIRSKEEILSDFKLACESREASLMGRKEVFLGRAKFGIFGDGKEVAQIALSKVFRVGDHRAGYYRDQTFMMAIGELTTQQYFAQLYAHTDVSADPASGGRQMNGHFATRMVDENGALRDLANLKNSRSDVSPTAAQMPRLLGLAYASKLFRNNPELRNLTHLSTEGNEIAFGMIGNASTSEGPFFETMNAAGVLQVPMLVSVWDDDYGISVPQEYHTVKKSISKALAGLQRNAKEEGFEILVVNGWDYEALIRTYEKAEKICREYHVPVLVHVTEVTQPQGHSTSGSHERYKSKERLNWEKDYDCIKKMREYILSNELCSEDEVNQLEKDGKAAAKAAREAAWKDFNDDIQRDQQA
ncbi:thiamine pyrophosphate-dependent dehydrogenase E1 component subunit alpha, partial [bacterium]|nr:thiamine pyrophosphate-dependent dehydrogenase E1 component subunit alpha [bacterium]